MIAALLLFAAAVAIFAPGVVRILRANAELDRLADPTWQPDYDANVAAFDRLGVRR